MTVQDIYNKWIELYYIKNLSLTKTLHDFTNENIESTQIKLENFYSHIELGIVSDALTTFI